jgi:membrane dipeptidase
VAGLSRFGHDLVSRMNDLGVLVDLSHCGQRTTAEGIAASAWPRVATRAG